jgi:Ca2+-binding RTX toxin-like protein
MSDRAVGGNDTITTQGDGFPRTIIGDAYEMHDRAKAGNDRLISGIGSDEMWGDAVVKDGSVLTGSDTFVFGPNGGNDIVHDFEHGKDKIDLRTFASAGVHSLADLQWDVVEGDTQIHFDGSSSLTLLNVATLSKSDFLFA